MHPKKFEIREGRFYLDGAQLHGVMNWALDTHKNEGFVTATLEILVSVDEFPAGKISVRCDGRCDFCEKTCEHRCHGPVITGPRTP